MHNNSIPRTKIDCFTMDALEQIKATLNNQTPNFTNRGGGGKDVRELSDFALQQIKDAVGTNGGGGEIVQIKKMWVATLDKATGDESYTEIQPTVADDVTTYEITKEVGDIAYYATDDDNAPNTINGENIALVCPTSVQSISYIKNIGGHVQSYDEVLHILDINVIGDIAIDAENNTPPQPYMQISITYDGR